MTTTVTDFALIVPGPPRGQGRARINTRGVRPVHIMDPGSRTARDDLITHWIAAGRPSLPADAWYGVTVTAEFSRPAGHLLRDGTLNAAGRRRRYPGKPDADNIGKLGLDALVSCGAVPDDARLVWLHVVKAWSPTDTAQTTIRVVAL